MKILRIDGEMAKVYPGNAKSGKGGSEKAAGTVKRVAVSRGGGKELCNGLKRRDRGASDSKY